MKKIELKAIELLNNTYEISLASINTEGYPRVCIVSKLKNDGIGKLYFSTDINSVKANHFKINPKSSVCFHKNGDSVTLVGSVKRIDSVKEKNDLWQDWMSKHFANGINDPNYCVFEFITNKATIYINNEFETFEY